MDRKTIWVRDRLHEQRERPSKTAEIHLKKGFIVEELDWDKKTEAVTIHSRLILKNHKWLKEKETDKHKYLYLAFDKVNLGRAKKRKMKLIRKILKDQYPTLSYSFFDHFISSTKHKIDFGFIDANRFIKQIVKATNNGAKKIKMKEKQNGVKI